MSFHRHDRAGFTYIELVITLLVMGILAAVAAPSYRSALAYRRTDMAARRIKADLQYASSVTLQNSRDCIVRFNPGSNSYELEGVNELDRRGSYVVELAKEPFSAVIVSTTFGADAVTFDRWYGRPDGVGEVIVQSGGVSKQITLTLNASGKANVEITGVLP